MKMRTKPGKRGLLLVATLVAFSAMAATISINAGAYPHNTVGAAQGIGFSSESEHRVAALAPRAAFCSRLASSP